VNLAEAFRDCWETLLPIGREPSTGGYRRYAWTDADRACRDWFTGAARARELEVMVDRNGNLLAWWDGGGAATRAGVLTGSHLDSVPDGGAFDGPLGVISGLLAVDLMRNRGLRPLRPVGVAVFADEEGARFGLSCVGSRLAAGTVDPVAARGLVDSAGISLEAALTEAGVDPAGLGRDDALLAKAGAFVELHIEQGRRLAGLDAAVGVATGIWPHGRWRLDFGGEANHAGTTLLQHRHDPMLPFARTVLAARTAAEAAGGVATVGRVDVEPNATNAVPSAVRGWLDARAPDEPTMQRIVDEITEAARAAAEPHGVEVAVTRVSATPGVSFGTELRDRITFALAERGLHAPLLPTAAGHDAGILAPLVPTAMLFVRNPTGISHSPQEFATTEDCVIGVEALAAALEELACR
jgi:N-carbamoyl-L-amino-acid hydrolase